MRPAFLSPRWHHGHLLSTSSSTSITAPSRRLSLPLLPHFLLLLVLLACPPPASGTTPPAHQPDGHTPEPCDAATANASEDGYCVPPTWEVGMVDDFTWFERMCPAHTSDDARYRLLNYREQLRLQHLFIPLELREHPEEEESHSEVPYNILVIFGTFTLGAFCRYFCLMCPQVPYTVVIFLIGMGFGALGVWKETKANFEKYEQLAYMNPHMIFYIFLPVLIFESAFAMEIPVFKKVVWQCVIMAGPGLIVCSVATGYVASSVFTAYDWTFPACLLFGVILSATDPVAVVALLKELGASPVISTMIEGESLFNDGTAIVFFTVLKTSVEKGPSAGCVAVWETCGDQCACNADCVIPYTVVEIVLEFCKVSFGGPLIGLAMGALTVEAVGRVFNDPLIEITSTLCSAYITFYLCEAVAGVSGVLGLVMLGCWMSYYRECISPEVEHSLHKFWEMTVYLTNTCIFALAGMIVSLKAFSNITGRDLVYLLIIYLTINVVRMTTLLLFTPILRCFKHKLSVGESALVAWGGLRGAVGLALALIIQADENVVVPHVRDKFIFHVAGIVILTLLVNGITTQYLVAHFELDKVSDRKKKLMRDRFTDLQEYRTAQIQNLGWDETTATAYYDCNWARVLSLTDPATLLPEGQTDPYTKKGESVFDVGDPEYEHKVFEEARAVYFGAILSAIHMQYARGMLDPPSVRALHRLCIEAQEGKALKRYHQRQEQEKAVALMAAVRDGSGDGSGSGSGSGDDPEAPAPAEVESAGGAQAGRAVLHGLMDPYRLQGLFEPDSWLRKNFFSQTLVKALTVSLSFVAAHEVAEHRVKLVCDRKAASQIGMLCRRNITEMNAIINENTRRFPEISCALKTKHAVRQTLNKMKVIVGELGHEGRLDDEDRLALMAEVEARMKALVKKFPATMSLPADDEAYALAPFTEFCDRRSVEEIKRLFGGQLKTIAPKSPMHRKKEGIVGVYVVVSGIVSVRLGRRVFRYGSGYVLGLQHFLTGSARFDDVETETVCKMIYLDPEKLRWAVSSNENLSLALWRQCGVQAARLLMPQSPRFEKWSDTAVWHTARTGVVGILQDAQVEAPEAIRQHKLHPDTSYTLVLRGNCFEYEGQFPIRFPEIIPETYKFASFYQHAVIFEMEASDDASTRAKRKWGRLRSKTRSICLWSSLRGRYWGQVALALAMRCPLPPNLKEPKPQELLELERQHARALRKQEAAEAAADGSGSGSGGGGGGGGRKHRGGRSKRGDPFADAPLVFAEPYTPLSIASRTGGVVGAPAVSTYKAGKSQKRPPAPYGGFGSYDNAVHGYGYKPERGGHSSRGGAPSSKPLAVTPPDHIPSPLYEAAPLPVAAASMDSPAHHQRSNPLPAAALPSRGTVPASPRNHHHHHHSHNHHHPRRVSMIGGGSPPPPTPLQRRLSATSGSPTPRSPQPPLRRPSSNGASTTSSSAPLSSAASTRHHRLPSKPDFNKMIDESAKRAAAVGGGGGGSGRVGSR